MATRDLVRFRLLGPRSHALLMETLRPVWKNVPCESGGSKEVDDSGWSGSDEGDDDDDDDDSIELPPTEKWWLVGGLHSQLDIHSDVLSREYPAIKAKDGPAHFSRGCVLGLCVQDPRLFTPSKKTDMVSAFYPPKKDVLSGLCGTLREGEEGESTDMSVGEIASQNSPPPPLPSCLPPELSFSPIWDSLVCKSVSKSKIPDDYLNRKRSKKFVRSSVLKLGNSAPRIPVMLIQQPPHSSALQTTHNSLGSGWDLILPLEWAMAFWISLIYRGARACGLKEMRKCSLESQVLHFPQDFPDMLAGQQHNSEQRKEKEIHYLKRPPAIRINYGKLLVPTPFHISWEDLVRSWARRSNSNSDDSRETDDSEAVIPSVKPVVGDRKLELAPHVVSEPNSRGVKRTAGGGELAGMPCKRVKLEPGLAPATELVEGIRLEVGDVGSKLPVCNGTVRGASNSVPNIYRISQSPAFYVLRSREDLNSLRLFVASVFGRQGRASKFDLQSTIRNFAIDLLLEEHSSALVAVQVEIFCSGTLHELDRISSPSASDLCSLLSSNSSPRFSGPKEELNQHGMTVVGKKGLVVGITSLTRKDLKTAKKQKKGEAGVTVLHYPMSLCCVTYMQVCLGLVSLCITSSEYYN